VQGSDLFDKLGRNAKHIGTAASVATVAQTGYKFFATERPEERREVLVVAGFQATGGLAGAKAAGAVVAVVAMATPVGWVTVLAVGTVGAVGGSLAGERIGKWINEAEFFDPLGRRLEGFVTDWPDEVREGVVEAFKSAKAGAGDFATGIVEVGEAIGEGVADTAQGAWDAFSDGAQKVGGHLSDFGSATADGAANAWESVSDWFDD
jgi:hypothetical protein